MSFIRAILSHIRVALKHGKWQCGWETRKTWPTKSYWYFGYEYYDGYWAALHIGPFYVCVNY